MPADQIQFARDPASGVEAIRARFVGHAYDLHRHDDWLVGVTAFGVQDFFCRGGADRFQLARAFRAAYGVSPPAYRVQIRLMRARALLADGQRPAEVAAACGFADQSHFGRWFRRGYGLTPAAYRAGRTGVLEDTHPIG